MSRRRVAFARIAQETNALNPIPTTFEDFERTHYFEGPDLLAVCEPDGWEAQGFARNAELSGFVKATRDLGGGKIELYPLFSAWAIPAGPLSRDTFDFLKTKLINAILALSEDGPLDGLMLSLHGAMGCVGLDDPEGHLLRAVREACGAKTLISLSLDLHANLTPAKIEPVDMIAAYRTNPHRDHKRCGYRAGRLLVDALFGRTKPVIRWRTLPLILGGGTSVDFLPAVRPLFRRMKQMEKHPKVLDVSLFMCHPWNDTPDLGWGTLVVTDDAPELADSLAEDLADQAWDVRHKQPPTFPAAKEVIAKARKARLARRTGTVCVSDASDIVGAGALGESPRLLETLLAHAKGLRCLVPIRDAEVVNAVWGSAVLADVHVDVGAKLDPTSGEPLPIQGKLLSQHDTQPFGRIVVLEIEHVTLVVTEKAPLALKPAFYTDLGLSIWKSDITVVKSFFPWRIYFALYNRKTFYARTHGSTDLDAASRFTFTEAVHPFDSVSTWRPADRRRRGVTA